MSFEDYELVKGLYRRAGVSMDLCIVALNEAHRILGPSLVYTIYCGQCCYETGVQIQRAASAGSINNPFAPVVNVYPHPRLDSQEWYVVTLEEKAFGSSGY